jgi:hypothetical protein
MLVVVGLGGRVEAQTASAAALFASGDAALEARRYTDALRDCQAAVALLSSAPSEQRGRARFCAAQAARGLGRIATALDAASAAVRDIEQGAANQPRYARDLRRAREMVREISPDVPRVTIAIEPAEARPVARVTINGEPVDAALIGRPLARDPGELDVRVEAAGYAPAWQATRLAARDNRRLELRLTASSDGATTPSLPGARRGISPLVWVGAGVTVVSAAIAIGLGVSGNGTLSDYEAACVTAAPQGDCATRQGAVQESLDGQAVAVNVAWGVAAAGLVVAGVGLITTLTGSSAPGPRPTAAVNWGVMPGGAAMRVVW